MRWAARGRTPGGVFTHEDGTAYHPAQATSRFYRRSNEAGLPPIRLHDLRHGAATLAAGKSMKEVQVLLRHSSEAITSEIYAHVLPELQAEVSAAVVSMVPRRKRVPEGGLEDAVDAAGPTSVPQGYPLYCRSRSQAMNCLVRLVGRQGFEP